MADLAFAAGGAADTEIAGTARSLLEAAVELAEVVSRADLPSEAVVLHCVHLSRPVRLGGCGWLLHKAQVDCNVDFLLADDLVDGK